MSKNEIAYAPFVIGVVVTVFIVTLIWPSTTASKPQTIVTTYENGQRLNVNVRGIRWNVFIQNSTDQWATRLADEDALGQTECDGSYAIHIAPSLTYYVQKETIFHELLHAATCGIDGTLHNEYFNSQAHGYHPGLDRIASYTTTLMQDNPELAHYLIGR